jgi:hypothetical protein
MKKIFSISLFIYLIASFFFFRKIIQTDIGLIGYSVISMLMLFLFFRQKAKEIKKD